MDITEFLELCVGKWFSQRTVHNLSSGQLQAGKSTLKIDHLQQNDATVAQVCQAYQVDPTTAWGGLQFSWEGTIERQTQQQKGSSLLVPLIHSENSHEGQFLQRRGDSQNQSLQGCYILGKDEVLTLITSSDSFYAEERLWYLMPNLRLRTSIVTHNNGLTQASFCSEIRLVSG